MQRAIISSYLMVPVFVLITLTSTSTNAFFGDTCEVVLKKGDYTCTFEASDETRSVQAELFGTFEPFEGPSSSFPSPFAFDVIDIAVGTQPPSLSSPSLTDAQELACGCDAKGFSDPMINASRSFTCVGTALGGPMSFLSFSGTPILGGHVIYNANLTIFNPNFFDRGPFYTNSKGKCVPGPNGNPE